MKGKNVFFALGLALTMGLGVGAALSGAKAIKPAKANVERTVYCAISTETLSTYTLKLNVLVGDATWLQSDMVDLEDSITYPGKKVFKGTFEERYDGVDKMQFQLYDSNWVKQDEVIGTYTASTVYSGKLHIYDGSGWVSYTEPAPVVHTYKYAINDSEEYTALTKDPSKPEYSMDDNATFSAGDVIHLKLDDVAHNPTLTVGDQFNVNNATIVDGDITVTRAFTGNFYWDVSTDKLWVSGHTASNGDVFLNGSFDSWYGIDTKGATFDDNEYTFSNVVLENGAKVKAFEFNAAGADDNAKKSWIQPSSVSCNHSAEYPVEIDTTDYNNILVTNGGTFDITVNKTTKAYSFVAKGYVAPDYKVLCGLSEYEFEPDEDGKPEGVVHQFSTIIDYAYRERTLTFYNGDDPITANIGVDYDGPNPVAGNNIVGDVTNGFRIYHGLTNMKVYLKVYSGGGISLWGTGYAENEYYLHGTAISTLAIDNDFTPEGDYTKQYKTSAAVALSVLTTETKYYIMDNGGSAMQTVHVESVAGNNAVAVTSNYFNLHNDCNQVVYLKMKADLSLWLYIGGYVEAHVLTIGGQVINMVQFDGNQYKAAGVNLNAGDAFASYTIEGVAVTGVTAKVVGNNNLGSDMKIIADVASADIYYNINTKQLHVSGLPTGGYHILKNGHELVQMVAAGESEGFIQWKSESLSFAEDDVFTFLDCTGEEGVEGAVKWTIHKISTYGQGSKFEYDSTDDVIVCKEDCTTAVYMKMKMDADEIYFGEVEEYIEKAIEFANGFKSAMLAACADASKQSAVESAWALQVTAYAGLSEATKGELHLGSGSSVLEVKEFAGRYLAIKSQHSTWNLENFMGWSIPSSGNIIPSMILNNSSTTLVVVVVSLVVITASACAARFLLKKKREN